LLKSYTGLTAAGTVQESSVLKIHLFPFYIPKNRKPIRRQMYTKVRNGGINLVKVVIFAMHKNAATIYV
jgi:hypothetical protein